MRVLHVTSYFAPAFVYGGPPRSILGLCQALESAKVQIQVFTTTANGQVDFHESLEEFEYYQGIPVHYFPRVFPRRFYRAKGLASAIQAINHRIDLLHIHGLWNLTAWAAAQQAIKLKLPYVISPRGMLDPGSIMHKSWRKRLAFPLIEKSNLLKASFLHATSATEQAALKDHGFVDKVFVLPNGVQPDSVKLWPAGTFRKAHGLNESAKLVVFLGRIHPVKRLDLLAAAFTRLRQNVPAARLIIAGPNENDYRTALEPNFKQIKQAVLWLGEVDQDRKWALLQDADALVMCSDSESFGVSVAEAMYAGLPVVVTRTCPWEEVETAQCGFWVKQDAQTIADALYYLLTHPLEAVAMGERGKKLALEKYSWERIAAQMVKYYELAVRSSK